MSNQLPLGRATQSPSFSLHPTGRNPVVLSPEFAVLEPYKRATVLFHGRQRRFASPPDPSPNCQWSRHMHCTLETCLLSTRPGSLPTQQQQQQQWQQKRAIRLQRVAIGPPDLARPNLGLVNSRRVAGRVEARRLQIPRGDGDKDPGPTRGPPSSFTPHPQRLFQPC